MFLCFKYFNCR